ncbi:uncharacterized protein LOC117329561 [Pecten maximus]|uniref:uncharacterized protein LOC117329561 n=1 Tax=Pecten maximus TaxID=6579 RepID=UPI0014580BE6|nr:uncharacterized protein LOC117329561 [Pecten maximus]
MFFDKIIPYVFWARGDLHQASTLFTKLIEGDKRSRFRAMCMIEIARMHAQLGEPEVACRFYRMASDIALEKGKAAKHDKEVFGQTLMLLASVYDQGMMTMSKARTAADHWKYVVTSETFNQGAVNMAAISMLCFHSRPGSDTEPSSFVEARSRLDAMVQVCPSYLYYISMLQALAGQESDADNTYRTFIQRETENGNYDAPGLRMISSVSSSSGSRRKRQNFWHNLSAMVTKSGSPQPLHVLWRSHLQPLRVCDPTSEIPPTEADLCCDNLDLRLNSQGYLTGNMKLLLPPMRSINLDPYTGKLCFPQTPGRTEPWTSLDRFSDIHEGHKEFDNAHIPCPLEVYRHEDGTTVQMMLLSSLKRSGSSHHRNKQETVTLFWSKGQTAKLSLLKIFWQLVYEKMILTIKRNALKCKKSEQWQKDCLKVLKHCLDTKTKIEYNWIIDRVELDLPEERKKNAKALLMKILLSRKNDISPELYWDNKNISYGKTLALSFSFCEETISVFVDCSSRETFLQPEIRIDSRDTRFPNIPNNKNHKLVGAEIFYYYGSRDYHNDSRCVRICGQKGKVLEEIQMEGDGMGDRVPYVIGSSLLIITNRSRLWCWNDSKIKVDETLPELQNIISTESSVVMVTLRDRDAVRFVNTPSLESVPVRASCDMMERLKITEDGFEIKATKANLKVLTTRARTENGHSFQEVVLGLDVNLVTLHILQNDKRSTEVVITEVLPIPGLPIEHCFIGKRGGYLVSWTQQYEGAKEYKENLFYFSKDSELLCVLPCLGKGPRSFFPLHLPGDSDTQKDYPGYGLPGWYVYMRDGHDGIIAVKLPTC